MRPQLGRKLVADQLDQMLVRRVLQAVDDGLDDPPEV